MPYIRGQYHFPSTPSPGQIDARGAAFIRLQVSLWNVLAFHHDREREREAHWQQRAKDCAAELRRLLDPYEASAAIGELGDKPRLGLRVSWPPAKSGQRNVVSNQNLKRRKASRFLAGAGRSARSSSEGLYERTVAAIRLALEEAGIESSRRMGGGAGVRLQEATHDEQACRERFMLLR